MVLVGSMSLLCHLVVDSLRVERFLMVCLVGVNALHHCSWNFALIGYPWFVTVRPF